VLTPVGLWPPSISPGAELIKPEITYRKYFLIENSFKDPWDLKNPVI
jgi:hypothetical protein